METTTTTLPPPKYTEIPGLAKSMTNSTTTKASKIKTTPIPYLGLTMLKVPKAAKETTTQSVITKTKAPLVTDKELLSTNETKTKPTETTTKPLRTATFDKKINSGNVIDSDKLIFNGNVDTPRSGEGRADLLNKIDVMNDSKNLSIMHGKK